MDSASDKRSFNAITLNQRSFIVNSAFCSGYRLEEKIRFNQHVINVDSTI